MLDDATEIRKRAEIRAGELLAEMAVNGERTVRKNMKSQAATSKLVDLGVTKSKHAISSEISAPQMPAVRL
jgi:hypothetical protein